MVPARPLHSPRVNASAGLPVTPTRRLAIRWLTATVAAITAALLWNVPSHSAAPLSPRAYAKQLATSQYGWTGYEWTALDTIAVRESGWNPCAYNPGQSDCGYTGSHSCGVPQRYPCPSEWRGRLGSTWMAQVRWFLSYVKGRYGSPSHALAVWNAQGWY